MTDPHLAMICYISKKDKPCLLDFSSKSPSVILMFRLLIKSFLLQGSNGISTTVALGHCFLAEISDSIIPLTSSGRLWFVCSRKNENIFNTRIIGKNLNFAFSIIHVEFYPQVY